MGFSKKEEKHLEKEIQSVYKKVADFLLDYLRPQRISVEAVTYGLLRVAALLAVNTGCKKETFQKLAKFAYEHEKPFEQAAKLLDDAKKRDLN